MGARDTIRLAAVGDIALNAGYEDLLRQGKGQEVFAGIAPLFANADLVIGNLEGPLTERPSVSPPWRHCLRGNPRYAPMLRAAGFHVLSLANNHMMDYGWAGIEETIERLTAQGIHTVGAGRNLEEARRPVQVDVNGLNISFLAYCAVPIASPFHLYADVNKPGIAPARREWIIEDVLAAKMQCGLVCVILHWGQEHVKYPAPSQRRLARQIIAAGADLIIGHHPHVLQGVETIGEGLVAYSLGNFTFADEIWFGANRDGASFTMPMHMSETSRRTTVLKVQMGQGEKSRTHETVPAYLGADLRVVEDSSPERKEQLEQRSKFLHKPGYSLFWLGAMLTSRAVAFKAQMGLSRQFWKRLHRLRFRHIREVFRSLGREWEQFRGEK